MFIKTDYYGYNNQGEQIAHGLFLIIVADHRHIYSSSNTRPELRAIVRHARMVQCGHFMMASVRLGKHWFVLSGAYGSDGLPKNLPRTNSSPPYEVQVSEEDADTIFKQLIPLPADLVEAFWNGGGHNSCGNEAPALQKWALENLKALHKPIKSTL